MKTFIRTMFIALGISLGITIALWVQDYYQWHIAIPIIGLHLLILDGLHQTWKKVEPSGWVR